MTFEERLEKVEKQNRNLRKLSFASIAIALAALIGGTALSVRAWTAAIEPDSVTTKLLVIKDPNSNRTAMALNGNGTFIMFDGNNSAKRVVLSRSGEFGVYDSYERPRVLLNSEGKFSVAGIDPRNGVSLSPGNIAMWDTNGIQRANISNAGVALYDTNGKWRASLGSGGDLRLNDANGRTRLHLDAPVNMMIFYDQNGKGRAFMSSEGGINLRDSNGMERIRLNTAANKIHFYNASGAAVAAIP